MIFFWRIALFCAVSWQAIAQHSLSSTNSCQQANVPVSERSVRHYDGLNRMIALNHPAGSDDMAMSYAADGALVTASLVTLNTATPPTLSSAKKQRRKKQRREQRRTRVFHK
jgi:hypothetical protein